MPTSVGHLEIMPLPAPALGISLGREAFRSYPNPAESPLGARPVKPAWLRECWSRGFVPDRPMLLGPTKDALAITPARTRHTLNFSRDGPRSMTELMQSGVSLVTRGAVHEFGMAGAVKFPSLVKSRGLMVGSVDHGQRSKYRGLVLAVPRAPRTADRQSRRHVRHPAHAPALCGVCFWVRIQVVPSARGWSADLSVRHLAVERCRRPVGGNRGRDLLRGAVGDYPAPAGHDDGSGHHLERRVGDLAVDSHRGMLLMVCGVDHSLFGQRHRDHRDCRLSGVSRDHRRPDVPEPMAGCRWQQASETSRGFP